MITLRKLTPKKMALLHELSYYMTPEQIDAWLQRTNTTAQELVENALVSKEKVWRQRRQKQHEPK
jgi:hypothetical protein